MKFKQYETTNGGHYTVHETGEVFKEKRYVLGTDDCLAPMIRGLLADILDFELLDKGDSIEWVYNEADAGVVHAVSTRITSIRDWSPM